MKFEIGKKYCLLDKIILISREKYGYDKTILRLLNKNPKILTKKAISGDGFSLAFENEGLTYYSTEAGVFCNFRECYQQEEMDL